MADPACQCNMYKQLGICWHTGYRPTFVLREPVPVHELRRRAFLKLLKEIHPNAEDVKDQSG